MRIITLNVNGIRSSQKKGLFEFLQEQNADFVCLQEVRAQPHQLTAPEFCPIGYHCEYVAAERPGYSGVAIYAKKPPQAVVRECGLDWADKEGRYIAFEYDDFSIMSIYFPSGTSGEVRQAQKYRFLDYIYGEFEKQVKQGKPAFICGDVNIAHTHRDLKNAKSNEKTSGFLPEERAWLDKLFNDMGWVDAFRVVNQKDEEYTWWSNFGRAWEKNVGWRIDYQVISPELKSAVQSASIYKDKRFSDHAPVIIDYSL